MEFRKAELKLRKFLTFIAVILFAVSITDYMLTPKNIIHLSSQAATTKTDTQEVPSQVVNYQQTEEEPEIEPQATAKPLFGDESERFTAHRGFSNEAPENSIAAFSLAATSGFWGIETDIQQTLDGQFVCMHDDTIDRTTNGTGTIAQKNYAELLAYQIDNGNRVDAYPNQHIPTMSEYLEICRNYDMVAIIEIKKISNYEAFVSLIYDEGMQDRCIITGAYEDLIRVREWNTSIPVMVVAYSSVDNNKYLSMMDYFPDGNAGILFNYPSLTKDVIDLLHKKGLYCGVWSLDTPELATSFLSNNVDYIVSNKIPGLNHMYNTNE